MGPIEALKGMVKLGGGLIGGTFKLVGKGVSSLVGVVSPGAKQWLDQTGQNFVDGFKNWGGSIANSADLGKIGNLKKMLINLFTKFAFALHKKMVAQAKDTGEKIAGTKNAIASGKNVDNILNKATAKTNAINKTNQSIGLGSVDKAPTLRR